MREPIKDPKRLHDILDSINNIFRYVGDDKMEAFITDIMRYHAVVYNLMIIGEAANMLTMEFRENHPLTPWKQITGMRNFLIHGYHQVEKDIVWKVIEEDLPTLRPQIVEYLAELES